jgi:hypothetical protein
MNNIIAAGLIVENGSFQMQNIGSDVATATGDVMALIGVAILAAVAIGVLYAIWLLLTQGN